MRVLLIGVGTVGDAIARICAQRDWCEQLVLADYDLERARGLQGVLGDDGMVEMEPGAHRPT